jgi:hypothetical protein
MVMLSWAPSWKSEGAQGGFQPFVSKSNHMRLEQRQPRIVRDYPSHPSKSVVN